MKYILIANPTMIRVIDCMIRFVPRVINIRTLLAMALIFCSSIGTACSSSDGDDGDTLMLFLFYYVLRYPAANQTYVSRAATALTTWNINLQTGVTAGERSTDTNYVMNPPNWITVANSGCNARGIPASWQGSTCSLTGGTIGLCITRFNTSGSTGKLVDTTLVMLDTFQSDTSQTEATKQSVFTHEVGHCLGLRHAEAGGASQCGGAYTNCNMYPSTAGADTPHAAELSAIDAAYNPIAVPPVDRYSQTSGVAIRHHSDPTFTVSSVIGSAYTDADSNETQSIAEPGVPIDGDIEVRVHAYKRDGTEEITIGHPYK